MPSAASLKRQINAATEAKPKPKKSYWELLDEIVASHPDTAKPPTELSTPLAEQLWLDENAKRECVFQLPNGLQFEQVNEQTPAGARSPCASACCVCNYRGMLTDGYEFDSSEERGGPITVQPGRMIEAWCIAMQLMAEGDHYRLVVPPHLAYGDAGRADQARGQYIPPAAVLIFDLQICSITSGATKPKPPQPPQSPSDAGFVATDRFVGTRPGSLRIAVPRLPTANAACVALGKTDAAAAGTAKTDPPTSAERSWANVVAASAPAGGAAKSDAADFEATTADAAPTAAVASVTSDESTSAVKQPQLVEASPREEGSRGEGSRGEGSAEEPKQPAEDFDEAALETMNAILANLRLPTLKQALEDLGLPVEGAKDELTARLSDRLTSGLVSGRSNGGSSASSARSISSARGAAASAAATPIGIE